MSAASNRTDEVVVGVDGGGTTTSALVADTTGAVRSSAEGGGSNPQHNPEAAARDRVQETVTLALERADRSLADVAALTAGFAGFNEPSDREWAASFVALEGLECEPLCVNDAVVAHAGALRGEPGVVPICGTGSIVFAITAEGRVIRNYDLGHYADAAARHLGKRALYELVAGRGQEGDSDLVDALLERWEVDSRADLRRVLLETDAFSTETAGNRLDAVAPLLTEAADSGSTLAQRVCDDALAEVCVGIECVGGYLESPVSVAPTGSVLRSAYLHRRLREELEGGSAREFRVVEPAMNPVAGAAFVSLQRHLGEGPAFDAAVARLESAPEARR
ncbi:BadF/BadG/BcrA/BcrD ATPase family protein [Natronobiforma cellulositropha]|uniref:BadF/BadG/BcrA/BcrD ATPase family protein n=1 Tax=Natronobiforma cellulositropha TaxID=1679076 RepID=UPI0021D5DAB4|nr:BadF/BadG/BcrA/BcrD ATPase family protein [Natronobiforma cellulositropha]